VAGSIASATSPGGPFAAGPGTVATFDDHAGLGTVRGGDGRSWPFHCTAITDGTRTIEVGTAVTFAVAPGRGGAWEAVEVRPEP
jgi:cold shock CspA family protein